MQSTTIKYIREKGNVNSNGKEILITIKFPEGNCMAKMKKDRRKRRTIVHDIVIFIILSHPYQLHSTILFTKLIILKGCLSIWFIFFVRNGGIKCSIVNIKGKGKKPCTANLVTSIMKNCAYTYKYGVVSTTLCKKGNLFFVNLVQKVQKPQKLQEVQKLLEEQKQQRKQKPHFAKVFCTNMIKCNQFLENEDINIFILW